MYKVIKSIKIVNIFEEQVFDDTRYAVCSNGLFFFFSIRCCTKNGCYLSFSFSIIVYKILIDNKNPKSIVSELMNRDLVNEASN